jgi:hypothetical protein
LETPFGHGNPVIGVDFELYYRAAREKAAALHLDADALLQAHALVVSMLGDKWFEKQAKDALRDRMFHEIHPLYIWLRSSAEAGLVEVAEFATYLKAFENDPSLEDVLAHLRTREDFEPAMFELAMAYRWRRAGATVTLAPSLPGGGKADFGAVVEGINYTVEVSSSPRRMIDPVAASFAKTVLKAIRTAASDHDHIAVELVLTSIPPKVDLHGPITRATKQAIRDFKRTGERTEMTLAFGALVVRVTPDDRDDEAEGLWHIGQQLFLKEPPEDGTAYDGHTQPTLGRGCAIYVRLSKDDRDLYDHLLAKYRKEVKQLAHIEDRVILLDAGGVKADALTMNMERVNDTIGQELLADVATSAVWIATRGYSEYLRPMYRIVTMTNPNAQHPIPATFTEHMSDQEETVDIITSGDLDWKPNRRFEDPL